MVVIPPVLEALRSDGSWLEVDVTVGIPAGKTKTIYVDLTGKLPPDTKRLRLTTTFEIRWDCIRLMQRSNPENIRMKSADPVSAELEFYGFSKLKAKSNLHPTLPDTNDINAKPPWRTTLEGWHANFGDVLELVQSEDRKLLVVSAGEAVDLAFDANTFGDVPEGMTRSFFFYSYGWDKDADYNVVHGDTILPWPVEMDSFMREGKADPDNWQIRYYQRWVPRDYFYPENEDSLKTKN